MTTQQLRRWTIIGLVFVLALAIFWESWQATVAAAADGGRPTPKLWPVTLEGLLAVLVLVYWDARHDRRPYAWVVQVAVWAVTAAAAVVQVLDAPETWLGWTTAALTPAMLLLAVEFAVWLLYGGTVAAAEGVEGAGKLRDIGPPGQAAGDVAVIGGHTVVPEGAPVANESRVEAHQRLSGIPATPPPSTPVPVAVDADSLTAGEDGSLSDRPRPVTPAATPATDRGRTVIRRPYDPRQEAILYRQRERPDGFAAMIAKHGFVPEEAWALARERRWSVASGNGHRKEVPA